MKKPNSHFLWIVFLVMTTLFSVSGTQKTAAKENIIIVIDPGHGGNTTKDETDLGASYNGVFEKEIDLITANALVDELSQYPNITTYMTRTEDVHMELQDRADFAASVGADMYISVHYNASAHHRFYGTEIFTSAFGEEYAKGYSLAKNIDRYWKNDGNVSKGVKVRIGAHGDYYGVIRMCRKYGIPAMILEHGYLDNDRDFEKLCTRESWEHMGRLDAAAIADYYGLTKGAASDSIREDLIVDIPEDHVENDPTPPENVSISIDSYDPVTRELTYTVSATEPDSFLMYYGLDTTVLAEDPDKGFMDLSVWDENASFMQGTFIVPEGYEGTFNARVYNNYEQYTDTNAVRIPEEMLESETTEDPETASGDISEIYDVSEVMDLDSEAVENNTQENTGSENGEDRTEKILSILIFITLALSCLLAILILIRIFTGHRSHRNRR